MLYTLKKADEKSLKEIREEMEIRKTKEVFLLFSLGSQFDHLIKEQIDKLRVFCLVADPVSVNASDVEKIGPKGIFLSGGPVSVYEEPPKFDARIFELGIPILGICLGFQLWAQHLGLEVKNASNREFGTHSLKILEDIDLLKDCDQITPVLQSHGDVVVDDGQLRILASTENSPIAAANFKHLWGVQFHPEVTETVCGPTIFSNFLFTICQAKDKYPSERVAEEKIKKIRNEVGYKKVTLALSGGSDSSTLAYLLMKALPDFANQVEFVYIKGIDRPDDEHYVRQYFGNLGPKLKIIDATDRFISVLIDKKTMPEKRVAMRSVYKEILEEEADKFCARFIAQGTLYTDISESGHGYDAGAKKAQIKLHHNVRLGFKLQELTPLDDCVKDSGRNIGRAIGVPEELLTRHPFPGPGLVVRIEGEIDKQKLVMARKADDIYIEELRKWNLYHTVWQAGVVITSSITTCTKGDDAVSGWVIALWAVWSVNGFTARAAELPVDFIKCVARRITNEIREAGAVVYRYSDKPPATIEWG